MKNRENTSKLRPIYEEIMKCPDFNSRKELSIKLVQESTIVDKTKKMMVIKIQNTQTDIKLIKYILDSMLYFEGMGVKK